MSNKKVSNEDKQVFTILGIVFSGLALTFLIGDTTRAVGFAFLAMGITFVIVGLASATKKSRKN